MSVAFGVFGGSFDPPHVAHTLLAAYVLTAHPIERVLVVPTCSHPLNKSLSAFEDRLRMCELAFADLPRVEVSAIERTLAQPNFTLLTIEALMQQHPGIQLRLLIGSDLLSQTPSWHNFERLRVLAPPLVIERQGHAQLDPQQPALPDVSSTEIRRRLRSGESTEGLLSPAVELYARSRGLYAVTA